LETVTVRIEEWQSLAPEVGSPTRGIFLPQDPATSRLVETLGKDRVLGLQELRSGLSIQSYSFVGSLTIGGIRVVVVPKLRGMQLMRLLRYAYRLRELKLFDPSPSALETDSFQDLLIHQLLAETDEIISRGLHQRYVPVSARLTSPRGRIDLAAVARDGFVSSALPCNFHPRDEDCLLNRVLLFGLRQAARMATDCELRHRARRTARILEQDVSDVHVDRATLARLRREMNRLTTAYEPALAILEILLGRFGTSLNLSSRETEVPGFLFDMNRFFQALLGRFLTQYLADHQITEQASIRGLFEYSAKQNPKRRPSPTPRPDYCVRTPDRRVLMLDAKYRDLWEQELPREMLYQLALYALSQKPVGRSTILYPTLAPNAVDAVIHVSEPFSGSRRAEVVLRPVDLHRLSELLGMPPGITTERSRCSFAEDLIAVPDPNVTSIAASAPARA
jgi:5-methylcytosine-specific restriction enzyme subunit McrC